MEIFLNYFIMKWINQEALSFFCAHSGKCGGSRKKLRRNRVKIVDGSQTQIAYALKYSAEKE